MPYRFHEEKPVLFKDKRFAKILGEKLEDKKILDIDIVDGAFKKFPGKKSNEELYLQREVLFFLFQGVLFPPYEILNFLIDFLREFRKLE